MPQNSGYITCDCRYLWAVILLHEEIENLHSHRRASRGEESGRPPCPFWKIEKSALVLEKNSNCVHTRVESSIENIVLRVSRGKSSKILPCGTFFLVFLTKSWSQCPNSTKSPWPKQFLVGHLLTVQWYQKDRME